MQISKENLNLFVEKVQKLNTSTIPSFSNGGKSKRLLEKGGKPKIHIKKENEGKFTEYCGGKVTEECIARGKRSPNAKIRSRATFAKNARGWKHRLGGKVKLIKK